ncbi:MAG: hypothetical protein LUE17_08705 [Planctomycetaceae bacterium]|nr:hypothetical protein [Planctomycetaceae bacterium]
MSSVLSELAAQARQAEAKAEAEAERARNKAEREAEKAAARAEAEIKARQDSVDRITATTVGNNFLTQIAEKSATGEWGPAEAEEAALSILQGEGSTPMFSKTFESYAVKGLGLVAENFSKLKREEETGACLSVARQALHDLHANYDPERFEE